jgi:hypothetical protein
MSNLRIPICLCTFKSKVTTNSRQTRFLKLKIKRFQELNKNSLFKLILKLILKLIFNKLNNSSHKSIKLIMKKIKRSLNKT